MTNSKNILISLFLIGFFADIKSQNLSNREFIYPDSMWSYVKNPVDLG